MGGLGVLEFLLGLAQAQPGFSEAGVPVSGFAETLRRGPVFALLEVVVADVQLLGRLKRIKAVFLVCDKVFVFFGRLLLLRGGLLLRFFSSGLRQDGEGGPKQEKIPA